MLFNTLSFSAFNANLMQFANILSWPSIYTSALNYKSNNYLAKSFAYSIKVGSLNPK